MRKNRRSIYGLIVIIVSILCACGSKEASGLQEAEVQEEKLLEEESKEESSKEHTQEAEKGQESAQAEESGVWVYVCGEVMCPGVYELSEGDRVIQAIEAAGGMTEEAAMSYLNQAEPVADGQKIYVPGMEEAKSLPEQTQEAASSESGNVNLNTATKEELMTLPGIGETKAESILKYRSEQGGFQSIEDIQKIEGIKEGTFNRLKDRITVS